MSEPGITERSDEPDESTGDSERQRLTYREWANALREGELLGQECGDCGHATAAPKAACVRCGSRDVATISLPTEGEVYAETTVAVPPERFEGPYQVALVDLGDSRVTVRIDGTISIGDRVRIGEAMEVEGHPAPMFGPAN